METCLRKCLPQVFCPLGVDLALPWLALCAHSSFTTQYLKVWDKPTPVMTNVLPDVSQRPHNTAEELWQETGTVANVLQTARQSIDMQKVLINP